MSSVVVEGVTGATAEDLDRGVPPFTHESEPFTVPSPEEMEAHRVWFDGWWQTWEAGRQALTEVESSPLRGRAGRLREALRLHSGAILANARLHPRGEAEGIASISRMAWQTVGDAEGVVGVGTLTEQDRLEWVLRAERDVSLANCTGTLEQGHGMGECVAELRNRLGLSPV